MGGKTSNTRLLTYSTKVPRVASLGPRPHNSLLNRLAGIPNSEQTARRKYSGVFIVRTFCAKGRWWVRSELFYYSYVEKILVRSSSEPKYKNHKKQSGSTRQKRAKSRFGRPVPIPETPFPRGFASRFWYVDWSIYVGSTYKKREANSRECRNDTRCRHLSIVKIRHFKQFGKKINKKRPIDIWLSSKKSINEPRPLEGFRHYICR